VSNENNTPASSYSARLLESNEDYTAASLSGERLLERQQEEISVHFQTPQGSSWVTIPRGETLKSIPGLLFSVNNRRVSTPYPLLDGDVVRTSGLGLGGRGKKKKGGPPAAKLAAEISKAAAGKKKKGKKGKGGSFSKGQRVKAVIVGKGGYMSNVMGAVRSILESNPNLLGGIGASVGHQFGVGSAGQLLGDHAHHLLMRKLKGSGDYESNIDDLRVNSLIKGGVDQNMSFGNSGEYVRVKHREYLGDLTTGASGTFTLNPINGFAVNPGLVESFPYLSTMAPMFQEYEIQGLVYETVPTTSPYNANSAMGEVIISAQYNVGLPPFSSKQQMLNSGYAVSARLDKPVMYGFECERQPYKQYLVRTGPSEVPLNLTDLGTVYFATSTASTFPANSIIAEIWVTYDIVMSKPFFPRPALGYALLNQTYTQNYLNADTDTEASLEFSAFAGAPLSLSNPFLQTNRYIAVGRCTRDGYNYDNSGENSPFDLGSESSFYNNPPSLAFNEPTGNGLGISLNGAEVGDIFHVHVIVTSNASFYPNLMTNAYSSITIAPSAKCEAYNATDGAPVFIGSSGMVATNVTEGAFGNPSGPLFPMVGTATTTVAPPLVTSSTSAQNFFRTTQQYGVMGGYCQGGNFTFTAGQTPSTVKGPQGTSAWAVGVFKCNAPVTGGSPMVLTVGFPYATFPAIGSYTWNGATATNDVQVNHNVHLEIHYMGKSAVLDLSKTLGSNLASYSNPPYPNISARGRRHVDPASAERGTQEDREDDISVISTGSSRGKQDFRSRI